MADDPLIREVFGLPELTSTETEQGRRFGQTMNRVEDPFSILKQQEGKAQAVLNLTEADFAKQALLYLRKQRPGTPDLDLVDDAAFYVTELKRKQALLKADSLRQGLSSTKVVHPGEAASALQQVIKEPGTGFPQSKLAPPEEADGMLWKAGKLGLDILGFGGKVAQAPMAATVQQLRRQGVAQNPTLISDKQIATELNDFMDGKPVQPSRRFGASLDASADASDVGYQTLDTISRSMFADDTLQVGRELELVNDAYKKRAEMFVAKHGKGMAPEAQATLLDNVTKALIANDAGKGEMESPLLHQGALEFAGDALVGGLPVAAAKQAYRGIKPVAKYLGAVADVKDVDLGRAALDQVKDAKIFGKALVSNRGEVAARMEGHEDLADKMKLGQYRANTAADMEQHLRKQVEGLVSEATGGTVFGAQVKEHEMYDALLNEAHPRHGEMLTRVEDLAVENPRLQQYLAEYRGLTDQLYEHGKSTGKLKRIEGDEVVEAGKVEYYTPQKVLDTKLQSRIDEAVNKAGFKSIEDVRNKLAYPEEAGAKVQGSVEQLPEDLKNYIRSTDDNKVRSLRYKKQANAATGSEQARTGKEYPFEKDILTQWRNTRTSEIAATKKAKEVQELHKVFVEDGIVLRGSNKAEMALKAEEIKKATGIELAELPEDYAREYTRIVGKPGEKLSELGVVYVPRVAGDRLQDIFTKPDAPTKAAKTLKAISDYAVKPFNDVWRGTHTVLAGLPLASTWWLQNMAGAVGIDVMGLGVKAANPKLQLQAAKSTLLAAGLGDPKAASSTIKTVSGEVKLGKVYEWMVEDGALGQDLSVNYSSDLGKGPLGYLATKMRGVIKGSGLQKLSNSVDDYQHAIHYLAGLEKYGTTTAGRAKTMQFVKEMSGMYQDMSPFMREVVREVIPFIGWQQFIVPRVVKSAWTNPQRIQVFNRSVQQLERYYGSQMDYGHEYIPSSVEAVPGFTAPPGDQPQNLPKDKPTMYPTGSFLMARPETPLASVGQLTNPESRYPIGPIPQYTQLALAVVLNGGRGPDGKQFNELKRFAPDLQRVFEDTGMGTFNKEMKESALGRPVYMLAEKQLEFIDAMVKAYWDSGQHGLAIDLYTRVGLAKFMGGWEDLAVRLANEVGLQEMLKLKKPIKVESVGSGWLNEQVVNPGREVEKYNEKVRQDSQ